MDVQERRIGDLTVRIDRLICVGFGDCLEASEHAFELDDEGIAVFRSEVESVSEEELIAACDSCPVDALTVFNLQGEQVVP